MHSSKLLFLALFFLISLNSCYNNKKNNSYTIYEDLELIKTTKKYRLKGLVKSVEKKTFGAKKEFGEIILTEPEHEILYDSKNGLNFKYPFSDPYFFDDFQLSYGRDKKLFFNKDGYLESILFIFRKSLFKKNSEGKLVEKFTDIPYDSFSLHEKFNVFPLRDFTKLFYDDKGKVVKIVNRQGNMHNDTSLIKYDRNNNIILKLKNNNKLNEILEFNYDSKASLTSIYTYIYSPYSKDSTLLQTIKYDYKTENKVEKSDIIYDFGDIAAKTLTGYEFFDYMYRPYEYINYAKQGVDTYYKFHYKDNLLIGLNLYDNNDEEILKHKISYNEQGDIIKHEMESPNMDSIEVEIGGEMVMLYDVPFKLENLNYQYDYDDKGNWIKQYISIGDSITYAVKRTIEYY
ncbi:MAG: hypothetical protein WD048_00760 [Chitinophagales bacterium]